ncbi:FAD-dependent oxidoreductase [Chenggangzhangella methanolivorans]|uniref:FAD-dependent oxidoreductase n=1 Tax=Chenggangzhangella methanolivorans TaxID=1437009 RepID=A0A9E6R6K4_9HYPH|nr:FAD-dependent oxidoreductase [Chenggangzhangella methanolivorans]
MDEMTFDVVVVGGGVTGVAAGIAAARAGAKAVVLEPRPFVGGNATTGLCLHSFLTRDRRQTVFGLAQEMVDRLKAIGAAVGHIPYDGFVSAVTPVDGDWFRILASEMLAEAGCQVIYGASVVGVERDGDAIDALTVAMKGGLRRVVANSYIDERRRRHRRARRRADAKGRGRHRQDAAGLDADALPPRRHAPHRQDARRSRPGDGRQARRERADPGLLQRHVQRLERRHRGREDLPEPRPQGVLQHRLAGPHQREHLRGVRRRRHGPARHVARLPGPDPAMREGRQFPREARARLRARLFRAAGGRGRAREPQHPRRYEITKEDVLEGRKFDDTVGRSASPWTSTTPTPARPISWMWAATARSTCPTARCCRRGSTT